VKCDDQVGVVKGNDESNALASYVSGEARTTLRIRVDESGSSD